MLRTKRKYLDIPKEEPKEPFTVQGKTSAEWEVPMDWDRYVYANAWAQAAGLIPAAPEQEYLDRSEPLIIQVANLGNNKAPVTLFLSNKTRTLAAPGYGNSTESTTIAITSNIVGVSYQEILSNSEQKPFEIGETLVISSTPGQVEQTIAIIHKTDTGHKIQDLIDSVIDPYQFQTDRAVSSKNYIVDGFTALQINSVAPHTVVTLYFYLKKRYSPTMIVASEDPSMKYGVPDIMRTVKE